MERKPVQSGNIRSVGYDPTGIGLLEVEFHSGGVYQYAGVPRVIHEEFLRANSLGHYFAVFIRANYPVERIHTETCGRYLQCHVSLCECWCHKVRKDITNGRAQENEKGAGSVPQETPKAAPKAKKATKKHQAV